MAPDETETATYYAVTNPRAQSRNPRSAIITESGGEVAMYDDEREAWGKCFALRQRHDTSKLTVREVTFGECDEAAALPDGPRYPTAEEYDPEYELMEDIGDGISPEDRRQEMGLVEDSTWYVPEEKPPIMTVTDVDQSGTYTSVSMNGYSYLINQVYVEWRQGVIYPVETTDDDDDHTDVVPAAPSPTAAPTLAAKMRRERFEVETTDYALTSEATN